MVFPFLTGKEIVIHHLLSLSPPLYVHGHACAVYYVGVVVTFLTLC